MVRIYFASKGTYQYAKILKLKQWNCLVVLALTEIPGASNDHVGSLFNLETAEILSLSGICNFYDSLKLRLCLCHEVWAGFKVMALARVVSPTVNNDYLTTWPSFTGFQGKLSYYFLRLVTPIFLLYMSRYMVPGSNIFRTVFLRIMRFITLIIKES